MYFSASLRTSPLGVGELRQPHSLSLQLMNVQVPFFFKYAVDYFNKLPPLTTPEGTIITMGTALLLGCE